VKLNDRITNSQLVCASTCLRKHAIAYLHGIRPESDVAPLRFGTRWHAALDRRAKGMALDANLAALRGEYDMARGADAERNQWLAYEAETLCVLLSLYDWRWSDMDATKRVDASEESFVVPIINPATGMPSRTFVFAGKTDRRIQLGDRRAIEENKTTSDDISPESNYWKRLRIDTQIARYVLAARHYGHAIDTVLYDVVKKPTMRPGIGIPLLDADGLKIVLDVAGNRVRTKDGKKWRESGSAADGFTLQTRPETPEEWAARLHAAVSAEPDKYFARREIPRTDADLAEARRDLWDMAQVLHQCDREKRWPRNSSACVGFGTCPYIDLCSTNWTPDDGNVPAGFIRVTDPHQELAS
jgi:hypothetical protein